jgi:hypothetical protein
MVTHLFVASVKAVGGNYEGSRVADWAWVPKGAWAFGI